MQKICAECTTGYAHTLENCPNCEVETYVWDHQLPDGWRQAVEQERIRLVQERLNELSAEDINDAVAPEQPERPKDSDSTEKWQNFAIALAPNQAEEIRGMKRDDLKQAFG